LSIATEHREAPEPRLGAESLDDHCSRPGDRGRSGIQFLVLVLEWGLMTEPIVDHEKLDVYRLPIEYAAASYRIAKALAGVSRTMNVDWSNHRWVHDRNFWLWYWSEQSKADW
jgi:hypothetical protein